MIARDILDVASRNTASTTLDSIRADVTTPTTVGRGRLPARAARNRSDTVVDVDLAGDWRFAWFPRFAEVPADAWSPEVDDTGWGTFPVPGVWELGGFGTPYYLGFSYPPAVGVRGRRLGRLDPEDSPTGVYRREIEVPSGWAGRRVLLRFDGVKSAFHVFIDGAAVGYSEGSMTGAEFDITRLAAPGSHLLSVVVHRYSTGTYLEDQDMWFLSGITRGVHLLAEHPDAPFDAVVHADFDPETRIARLALDVLAGTGGCRVLIDLGGETRSIAEGTLDSGVWSSAVELAGISPWSAETPVLYDLSIETSTPDGFVDRRRLRVGFRRVEIVGEEFRINGRPIVLHGVNRHDFHPERIWDVPSEVRETDIRLMKRANVNALRLSHYPNPDEVYRLADEYGLYVCDEAEIESHGVRRRGIPGDDPDWTPAVVDRVERMVRRSRNHPSVILWSLGNEAGDGENFRIAKRTIRALDASRPVHYEGDTTLETSEVFSLMYPTPELERTIGEGGDVTISVLQNVLNRLAADTKPFRAEQYRGMPVIACEYAHAMENSLGNFADHVENFHRYPRWAGGFIWDWVDQTIDLPLPDGRVRRAYGGDFGESPSDRYFCANGLVAADRSPNPAYAEVAAAYAFVRAEYRDGALQLTNRYVFDDLAELRLDWSIDCDGRSVSAGQVDDIRTAPGGRRTVEVEVPDAFGPGVWTLTVRFRQRASTRWADAGFVQAATQFELHRATRPVPRLGPWTISVRTIDLVVLERGSQRVEIDLRRGRIAALRDRGTDLLTTPLALNLWRVPTDNDRGLANFAPALERLLVSSRWKRAGRVVRARSATVLNPADGPVSVVMPLRLPHASAVLSVHADDRAGIVVDLSLTPRADLLRVGLIGTLREGLHRVEWLGRGPHENYRDRAAGALIGDWESSVAELTHAYPRPQENGNRTGLERISVLGRSGSLTVARETGEPFEASVRPYDQEALDAAQHADELPVSGPATLSLDIAQRGVGGDKPGELHLQPDARLPAGRTYRASWRLNWTMGPS